MNFKKLFFLVLIVSIIFSVSTISAADNETTQEIITQTNEANIIEITNENIELENTENQEILSENNNSIEIYVGENKTTDGGNGSYDNPYSTLELACQNVNGENKATVNIFNGTYKLDSLLKFNTSNLFINGIYGDVFIKGNYFALSSSFANFTFNNLIFNSKAFDGYANYGTYNNCTFIGEFQFRDNNNWDCRGFTLYNFKAINCVFKDFTNSLFGNELYGSKFIYFENCIFLNPQLDYFSSVMSYNKNITLNGVWFGENRKADYVKNLLIKGGNRWDGRRDISVTKYAIFSVSENYLGDNQYEIIGKLTWNGTDSSEGMENFPPMAVTLTSTTGEIQNAIIINGTFKVNYTSNSQNNTILAILDYQRIKLSFNTVNLQATPIDIYYGDNQYITIKFDRAVNGFLNITIDNKTYDGIKVSNTDLFVYTIEDIFTEGRYPIQIVLYNTGNTIHGLGFSELSVSKVIGYDFVPILPSDAKVGVNKISFELPDDATGNITIFFGENNYTIDVSNNTEILIDGFVEGNNLIKISYSGDNKYVNKSMDRIVTAEKFEVDLEDNLIFTPPSGNDVGRFTFNLPTEVKGNLTVNINGKNYTQIIVNGNACIDIDDLGPGKYEAIIYYSGDDKFYLNMIKNSFVISKPILTAQDMSIAYTSVKLYMVKVTRGGRQSTGKIVTFNINGKLITAKTNNNGYASVKINLPPKNSAYAITASYLGVNVKKKITVKSIVVAKNLNVKKTAKKITIKVSLKKVDNKYLKGKMVYLKFNGITYKVKTNKMGVATFIIKNNVIKNLKAGKKYTYRVTYLKDTISKVIAVKK